MAPHPRPTLRLRDVAERAGVSTSTVARVLHRNGYVAAATRERVEAAMKEGDFRLNAVASGLKRQRTTTIGTLVHDASAHPFLASVALGVEQAASERGFHVLVIDARESAERERAGVEALLSQQVAAIVLVRPLEVANVALAATAGVPVVEVERRLLRDGAAILIDDHAGAMAGMRHLLDLGHAAIGLIGAAATLEVAHREALPENTSDRARTALVEPGAPGESGAVLAARLLERRPDITAILAASDALAAGALQELYARGIRVPADISVVGFGDTCAAQLAPPLTTVRRSPVELGVRAGELALTLTLTPGRQSPRRAEHLRPALIVRGSTAPPRAH